MNNIVKTTIATLLILMAALSSFAQAAKYKCMIQMNAYEGEKAYVVISLINPSGAYEKTLAVLGSDKQWYNTIKEWYKFQNKTKEKLNAVTGASVGGGDRAMRTLDLDETKFNKGYKLRFESAVEEQKYHTADVEIPLTKEAITEKANGKGYIKLVKLNKVQ
ncbi:DUF2271 domain-containing protein [Sphingobacterium sp. UGAL515B_05]|uniref:DUF2271 domain-containing protein n=1 Tax=Sphingobacterium sp. UGAL515B_05 TaxID=2986767 RepID=UPI002955A133|nr:DUF2271 domain-containing protein [Sphingobacterium sp. UGAL515B_05]WON92803.1 DUF2271 domain-containing protein [Sphingobacterium sp. UGAL515B_05]